MLDRPDRTPGRLTHGALGLAACLLLAVPVLAAGGLTPKNRDAAKIRQADALFADYKAKKLGPKEQAAYEQWLRAAQKQQQSVMKQQSAGKKSAGKKRAATLATPEQKGQGGPKGLAAVGGTQGSCHCTATCQTVLVVNGGSIYFEGEGQVSSPSACADAAEAFCGSAVSTFLNGWNCK